MEVTRFALFPSAGVWVGGWENLLKRKNSKQQDVQGDGGGDYIELRTTRLEASGSPEDGYTNKNQFYYSHRNVIGMMQ